MPDVAIGPVATGITGLVIWLATHLATRSKDRALLVRGSADRRENDNATMVTKALESYERQLVLIQQDNGKLRDQIDQREKEQSKREQAYEDRLARMERRHGRMHSFIVDIFSEYVNLRAYVAVLEDKIVLLCPEWRRRDFREMKLPNFEDEPALSSRP